MKKQGIKIKVLHIVAGLFAPSFISTAIAANFGQMLKDAIVQGVKDGINQPISNANNNTRGNDNDVTSKVEVYNQSDSGSHYSGSIRWELDKGTIEKIGKTAANESFAKENHYNQKYAQQDLKEFSSKWALKDATNKEFNLFYFNKKGDTPSYPAPMIVCKYEEPKDAFVESGVKSPFLQTVEITFWQAGARVNLDSGMYLTEGWDGRADAEVSECPANLANAIEAGFGVNIWSLKKVQYREAVDYRVNYLTKTVPEIEKSNEKSKSSKTKKAHW